MKLLSPLTTLSLVILFSSQLSAQGPSAKKPEQKIQVAILLDVSGSMSGLIDQAKAQLWSMVTTLGKAVCADKTQPKVELALYEYGRTSNDVNKGYVKQLSSFTNDLDEVSKILFSLNTNGGDEYCGEVIYASMDELAWDASQDSYKVIFIAGNEDFLQGKRHYTEACTKANAKGVIVNTIYCGDYQQGIREHWGLTGECGNGSYSNINHNAKDEDIPTPYDSILVVMNSKLNKTYIGYGANGEAYMARQGAVDKANFALSSKVAAKRIEAKAQSNVYGNSSWDLVDANKADSTYITSKLDKKTLPDSLKNKTVEELKLYVKEKTAERDAIQKDILTANSNRSRYIMEEKAKAASNSNQPTLESAVEKTIKQQASRFKMMID
ncbi:MAG TPA: vWA domain-containing protein [Chitinophagaceae bacterium]|jgi:hypothetical protein|nr:vWA domain-containing protein [Chitinophagaceae bacterium]